MFDGSAASAFRVFLAFNGLHSSRLFVALVSRRVLVLDAILENVHERTHATRQPAKAHLEFVCRARDCRFSAYARFRTFVTVQRL